MKLMPQEVELWYIYPSLRKEIAKIMINDYGFKQKDVAEKLNITKSAVSQYVNNKRSTKELFGGAIKAELELAVENIIKNDSDPMKEIQILLNHIRKTKVLCDIHRKLDKEVPKVCEICYEK